MLEKVGSHWMHPDRILHGRRSASIELLYFRNPSPGFDLDAARNRVQMARDKGCDVWLRIDYEPGQTLPPTGHEGALFNFRMWAAQAVASDPILGRSRGIICGNEPNLSAEWRLTQNPLTAEWVARCVYGFGTDLADTGNLYQEIKTVNPAMLVLAPGVGPFNPESSGNLPYLPPDGRSLLSPWELYQHELAWKSYHNNFHAPPDQVLFAVHTYSRVGPDGTHNGGAQEPRQDMREGMFGAQFGTRNLDDMLYAIRRANNDTPPTIVISEWNAGTDAAPISCYPDGLMQEVVRYVHTKPNVLALCSFVDQDLGGWAEFAMTTPGEARLFDWDQDYDDLLRNGW